MADALETMMKKLKTDEDGNFVISVEQLADLIAAAHGAGKSTGTATKQDTTIPAMDSAAAVARRDELFPDHLRLDRGAPLPKVAPKDARFPNSDRLGRH